MRSSLRMEVALNADRREMLSHFGFDTEELSIIRVHNAATDSILYRKAEELAKLEAEKFQSNVISDNVSPMELLVMQLDAYRYCNVPPVKKGVSTPCLRMCSLPRVLRHQQRRTANDVLGCIRSCSAISCASQINTTVYFACRGYVSIPSSSLFSANFLHE